MPSAVSVLLASSVKHTLLFAAQTSIEIGSLYEGINFYTSLKPYFEKLCIEDPEVD